MSTKDPSSANGQPSGDDNWEAAKCCPVCESKKGRCRVTKDGARAMCRYKHEGSVAAVDNGNAWIHLLDGAASEANGSTTTGRKQKENDGPTPDPAPADVRHEVYTALLGMMKLNQFHRRNLERRGLSAEAIEQNEYRSMVHRFQPHAAEELARQFGEDVLLTVPGFIRDERDKLSMSCLPGLIIPARDARGRIVALKCRPDKKLDNCDGR
jgi:hypothetical protein